jgi:alpha-tubulin suppressor-like RCC1 family protein
VTGFTQGAQAAGGVFHSCSVKTTGAAWCWGQGSDGQLGSGGTDATASPVAVSSLASGVLEVGAGGYHSCARKSDGTVWCWGRNTQGQLGDGTNTNRLTPVQVLGITGAQVLAVGGSHTCLLGGAGGVRCWGSNQFGQLGDGATSDRNAPNLVPQLTADAVSLGAGSFHSCATKTDGSAWCWGYNLNGRLGDGTVANRSSPVQVLGFSSGIARISAGGHQTCAVKTDGSVWCWGTNQFGQLGDGTTENRYEPVPVSGLSSGVFAVFSGGAHNCALLTTGALRCWGNNESGRLGDGTSTNRSSPVPVIFP